MCVCVCACVRMCVCQVRQGECVGSGSCHEDLPTHASLMAYYNLPRERQRDGGKELLKLQEEQNKSLDATRSKAPCGERHGRNKKPLPLAILF